MKNFVRLQYDPLTSGGGGGFNPYDFSNSGGSANENLGSNTGGSNTGTFDWNSVFSNAGSILGGAGSIINALKGNVPITNVYPNNIDNTTKSSNTVLYIVGGLLLLGVLFFALRN